MAAVTVLTRNVAWPPVVKPPLLMLSVPVTNPAIPPAAGRSRTPLPSCSVSVDPIVALTAERVTTVCALPLERERPGQAAEREDRQRSAGDPDAQVGPGRKARGRRRP